MVRVGNEEYARQNGSYGLTTLRNRHARVEGATVHFRFRGKLIHKICHFYLMETAESSTSPQRTEGITACRWLPFDEAEELCDLAIEWSVLTEYVRENTQIQRSRGDQLRC